MFTANFFLLNNNADESLLNKCCTSEKCVTHLFLTKWNEWRKKYNDNDIISVEFDVRYFDYIFNQKFFIQATVYLLYTVNSINIIIIYVIHFMSNFKSNANFDFYTEFPSLHNYQFAARYVKLSQINMTKVCQPKVFVCVRVNDLFILLLIFIWMNRLD